MSTYDGTGPARSPAMRMYLLLSLFAGGIAAISCTTETVEDDGAGGGESTRAPTWDDAPSDPVTIGEGRTVRIPLTATDPDGGEVTVTTTPPVGIDAVVVDGALELHVGYGAASSAVPVVITDDEGEATQVDVAVTVLPIGWVDYQDWTTAEGPEEREHATTLFHAESGQAFLFGGSGYHPQFVQMMDDFWRYDTATGTWTTITPTGDVPPAAGSRRFAGAWGSGEGMLFGGYGANNASYNDVYRVKVEGDTLAFDMLEPVDAVPFARSLHGFVYDAAGDRYFAFGGVSGFVYADTWMMEVEGDQVRWTELELPAAPSPRYGFFYGMDEVNRRMILFSGAQGTGDPMPANDVWALDMNTDPPQWVWLTDQGPPGRRNGCGVWDPTGPRLFVFGGTPDAMTTAPGLHVFDARPGFEGWTSPLPLDSEPDARSSGFGFFDGDRVYMGFGNNNAIYRDWGILGY